LGPCPSCYIRVRAILRVCYIRVTPLYTHQPGVHKTVLLAHHARPFEPSTKSHFWKISSTFGDKCPRNGSKNDTMVPRTTLEYPHEGPRMDILGCEPLSHLPVLTPRLGVLVSFLAIVRAEHTPLSSHDGTHQTIKSKFWP